MLRILGIAAVFSALSTPVQSMLQAVGRADVPVKLLFFGLLLKAALTYTLAGDAAVEPLRRGGEHARVLCGTFCSLPLYSFCMWPN